MHFCGFIGECINDFIVSSMFVLIALHVELVILRNNRHNKHKNALLWVYW